MLSPRIIVCNHPLLHHNLATVRDKNANHESFRLAIKRVTQFVLSTATAELPIVQKTVETPLASTQAIILSPQIPIIITPVLRAGLAMSEVLMDLIPTASVYHIGLYRDEKTLQPVTYYNKLGHHLDYKNARIFILDPMLATGGSVKAAIQIFKNLGADEANITLACIIAAPEGIKAVTTLFPQLKIVTAGIDQGLNENAYIIPGLGDAGDRIFGT